MVQLFANSGDPDQTPHSGSALFASYTLGVSRLQWDKSFGQFSDMTKTLITH